MKKRLLVFFLASTVPIAGAFAQISQTPLSLKARTERGLQRSDLQAFLDASKGGPAETNAVGLAIIAAGNTNDPFWIPYIKPFLKYSHNRYNELVALSGATQLALAKLGATEQLQEIACEANFGSSSIQYNAITQKLKYVQGWFSINLLDTWIEENHKFRRLLLDQWSDVVYARPQDLALKVLPEFVPNPPSFSSDPQLYYPMSGGDDEKLTPVRQAWREWIHQNEDSLRKLTPTGEGIDASEATCKGVLAHDQHFDRSGLVKK
jgi:hypothetical protein